MKSDGKKSNGFILLVANLTHFGTNLDIPDITLTRSRVCDATYWSKCSCGWYHAIVGGVQRVREGG